MMGGAVALLFVMTVCALAFRAALGGQQELIAFNLQRTFCFVFFLTLGAGLLDLKLNFFSCPELFLVYSSLIFGAPNPGEPNLVTGVPSPRVSLECPTPDYLYQERVGMFEVK